MMIMIFGNLATMLLFGIQVRTVAKQVPKHWLSFGSVGPGSIQDSGKEGWVNFSAENLMDEKDLVGVPGPGSQDVSVSRSIESFFKPAPPPTEDASALPLSTAHGDPEADAGQACCIETTD